MRLLPALAVVAAVAGAPALAACGSSAEPQAASTKHSASAGSSASSSPSSSPSPSPSSSVGDLVRLDGDGFTVDLPGKARSTTQTVPTQAGDIKITLYTATDSDGGTFVVAMNEYPPGTNLDLDGAVTGAAANVDGTVESKKTVEFLGNPARDARYTASPQGQPVTIWARLVEKGQKLFQLQYFLPQGDLVEAPAVYGQVLDTVKFD
ncbi:hypothetical protein [Marmoricola sp. RAF53]|uniref:hypothetical protein n=1 Tax=Marmoricola sp. RAF53 TaxID=3233059 RepID=UPI003F982525